MSAVLSETQTRDNADLMDKLLKIPGSPFIQNVETKQAADGRFQATLTLPNTFYPLSKVQIVSEAYERGSQAKRMASFRAIEMLKSKGLINQYF